MRLYSGRLASREEPGASPGIVLGLGDGTLRIAAQGGVIEVAKLRVGTGPKQAAQEAGIAPGERFD